MSTDKMTLWNAVEKTNPANTKNVSQRGGFTAIDAYAQIRNATEQFGPVGQGWGWMPVYRYERLHDECVLVICEVALWHGTEDQVVYAVGASELLAKTKYGLKPDPDAPKKALTDGITKALSYLGFNSDVFLGRFDDNKYVNQMRQEFAEKKAPPAQKPETPKPDTFAQEVQEAFGKPARPSFWDDGIKGGQFQGMTWAALERQPDAVDWLASLANHPKAPVRERASEALAYLSSLFQNPAVG